MYNLPHFKSDPDRVMEFMRDYPFAMLIAVDESGLPVMTQVPVFVDEKDGRIVLTGHIMRQTDHHKAFMAHPDVLVVFSGPHGYISAGWYVDPKQASTWNYMSVHAKGKIHLLPDNALPAILERITDHFEQRVGAFKDMTEGYVSSMSKAIVGFEVEVNQIEHVFKLSQNKDAQTFQQILDQLHKGTALDQHLAAEMTKEKLRQEGANSIKGRQ